MVALAGSKGGAIGDLGSVDRQFIHRLFSGRTDKDELFQYMKEHSRPSVGLVVNNACNLACKHCYLQVKQLLAPALKLGEWKRFAYSVAHSDAALISVCGKETLLGDTGMNVLAYLADMKAQDNLAYKFGIISNGTLMESHRDNLLEINPEYLDISFDGIAEDHDAVRGIGSFAKALPNMELASAHFGQRFFVTMTVQKKNYLKLGNTIEYFREHGAKNLFLTFYEPMAYTDQTLCMSDAEQETVLDRFDRLKRLPKGSEMNVYVDLGLYSPGPLKAFLRSKWFELSKVQLDDSGVCFVQHTFPNGVSLNFRFTPYPLGVWHTTRVTVEGLYLASEDTLDTSRYAENAIANIRDFYYDFNKLHHYALNSQRFHQIMDEYYDVTLPQIVKMYDLIRTNKIAA